jgi:hypothetical protein
MEAVMSPRLETISDNNKRNRLRDALFACFIALAAALAVTTMTSTSGVAPISQR